MVPLWEHEYKILLLKTLLFLEVLFFLYNKFAKKCIDFHGISQVIIFLDLTYEEESFQTTRINGGSQAYTVWIEYDVLCIKEIGVVFFCLPFY